MLSGVYQQVVKEALNLVTRVRHNGHPSYNSRFVSLGNGCDFPVRREHQLQTFTTQEAHGYESMGTTRSRSDKDGRQSTVTVNIP